MANIVNQNREFLTCTRLLYLMTILGFMTNYMLRVNLSIAIVDMIVPKTNNTNIVEATRFNWNTVEKNHLLGIFFWGYILTDVIGGRLSEIFGPRKVFGGGMLIASIFTLLTPLALYTHFYVGLLVRFILGLFLGVTFPSILPLAVKWIPPLDRSKFMSNIMSQGLGVAISMPICAYLISILAWPSVFYLTGFLGLLWSLFWFYLVFDSPEEHPRISVQEKLDIEKKFSVCGRRNDKPDKLPWKQMISSAPVWAIIVAHGTTGFCHFLLITQLPTYLNEVLRFDVKKNGIFSSIPSLGQYILAVLGSYVADKLRKSGKLTTLQTRRLFGSLTFFLPAILTATLLQWNENKAYIIFVLTASFSCLGFISAGHLSNPLDIAPNFSATIIGLATTLASAGGGLSTKLVAVITKNDNSSRSWQYVFGIMVLVYITGGVFFTIFVSGKVQKWNSDKSKLDEVDEDIKVVELLPLDEKSNCSEHVN